MVWLFEARSGKGSIDTDSQPETAFREPGLTLDVLQYIVMHTLHMSLSHVPIPKSKTML